jgi:NAD(P)-dependent dehydrogenase (short-subunit alcohol dehydrogenase family)
VCAAARREDRLRALVGEMGGERRGHLAIRCDVSSDEDVKALAARVEAAHGRCDVLVNNAGVSLPGRFDGPLAIERVRRVMDVNFFGAVRCTGELLDALERARPSSVVNVASMAGRLATPGASPYCASKFALVGWSEALHFELAPRGVWVSLVEPGFVPTEGFPARGLGGRLGRMALASPADVAAAILDAIAGRKLERVVPRFYRLAHLGRVVAPPLYRRGLAAVVERTDPPGDRPR